MQKRSLLILFIACVAAIFALVGVGFTCRRLRLPPPPPATPFHAYALKTLPKRVGERVEYRLQFKSEAIAAAQGVVSVDRSSDGSFLYINVDAVVMMRKPSWRNLSFAMQKSSHRCRCEVDAATLLPMRYLMERVESGKHGEHHITDLRVNPFTEKALSVRRKLEKKGHRPHVRELDVGSPLDPVSLGYYICERDFGAEPKLTAQFTNGTHPYSFTLSSMGRETITVKAGTYDTWKLKAVMTRQAGRSKGKTNTAFVWLTAGQPRLLVRFESAVFMGLASLNGEMTRYVPPQPSD